MPSRYEIRVKGRVTDALLPHFEGMAVHVEPVESTLYGKVEDQAALHGLLERIEALGLELIEVRRTAATPDGHAAAAPSLFCAVVAPVAVLYGWPMTFRVVIAEDHLLVREGLERILASSDDVELVGTAVDGEALLESVERARPDVVVTDVRMPSSDAHDGIRIAGELRRRFPEVAVLAISQYADPAYAFALFRDGARGRGYLLKERLTAPGELVAAIVEVASGGSAVDPLIVDALVAERSRGESSPLAALTAREHEVLAEVAAGKSNAAIASSLVITRRAVEHHIASIFAKLHLPSEQEVSRRVQATLLYLADRDSS